MSQFRTTADIIDEILTEAGEPTNGSSPFESAALTAANHVHHAIIGGGSIFNLTVDEPWSWARARNPITFELLPAVTAAFTATADSTAITFGSAPTQSLEGWHLQANGKNTVYKLTNHTAGSATATLDSGFIDGTGSYNCRAFKLDYEILPSYLYVDSLNDRVSFGETAATTYTASLAHGTYTPSSLITYIATQMSAAGSGTVSWTGSYDSVAKAFTLGAAATAAKLYAGGQRSGLLTVGFDQTNYTGATTYASTYTPNPIARLIEPFKHFRSGYSPYITSTDPVNMEQDFPLYMIQQRIPNRFARIAENADGSIWVRFNGYPDAKMKVQMDWIPQPIDLQDSTASRVLIPRGDLKTFVYAAAAHLLYQKEDNKFESVMALAKAGLEAMQRKNRAALFRTGENFGQIEPRADLTQPRKLRYGYTAGS